MNTQALDIQWQNLSPEKKQKALDLLFGEYISKRTKAALKQLKKTRKLGRPAFGYQFNEKGRLVENPNETPTLERILELHRNGNNPNSIATTLNNENRPSKTGKKWSRNVIRLIINRETAKNS